MTVIGAPLVDPGLLSRALEVGGRLANDAAEVIAATADRGCRGDANGRSSPFDWVTDTGRTLERHTRRVLAAEFPDIPVVGPEYHDVPEVGRYRWMVAPLDGIANYLSGLPWFAYGLALVDAGGPVLGVISDPSRAEIYAAARGRGSRVNGIPVRVTPNSRRARFPVCIEPGTDPWPAQLVSRAGSSGRAIRVLGSPTLAITQVALGHADAAVLYGYREWDVAAALAVAAEAGAVILNRDGEPDPLPCDGMLVAAGSAAQEALSWWR
ncbi:MAG TPA: inositol monophosphatase family protein [Pseudonocardia sp.]|jgi:myo-inositol-1(or 4)-monophosphatase|nr:inositol monophosphatase family protein [Pseudonocardia sp.]